MPDILVVIIFGWPFITLSMLTSFVDLITRRYWLLVAGGILFIPFSYYLSGAPAIRNLAFVLPLFQFASAYLVFRQKLFIAWVLLMPAPFIVIRLAFGVLSQ